MDKLDVRKEWRFYVTLLLGYVLLILGFFTNPPGIISSSVLIASGLLFSIGAMGLGIDIKGIIHEYRLLKENILNNVFEEKEDSQTNE